MSLYEIVTIIDGLEAIIARTRVFTEAIAIARSASARDYRNQIVSLLWCDSYGYGETIEEYINGEIYEL